MSNINDKLTELEAHLDVAEDTTELMSDAEKFGYGAAGAGVAGAGALGLRYGKRVKQAMRSGGFKAGAESLRRGIRADAAALRGVGQKGMAATKSGMASGMAATKGGMAAAKGGMARGMAATKTAGAKGMAMAAAKKAMLKKLLFRGKG